MMINIDKLNIFLIILSGILAIIFPLELFILAYVILGPLHYLTEINWLDTKGYFFSNRNRIWLYIGFIATGLIIAPKLFIEYLPEGTAFKNSILSFNEWTNGFIFIPLCIAIGSQFIRNRLGWIFLSSFAVLAGVLLNGNSHYGIIIGLFVPTIIHVYLFTLLFMFYGAKKSRSTYGYISVAAAIIFPLVFLVIDLGKSEYLFPDTLKQIYLENNFHFTPVLLSKYLGLSDGSSFFFYESIELRLMMFISFIYLYHYLNWFSKTTVIRWHRNLTKPRAIIILCLWIIMLSLFYIDFRLGFLVSLFFSFLHVILEFPLNMKSLKGIFSKTTLMK